MNMSSLDKEKSKFGHREECILMYVSISSSLLLHETPVKPSRHRIENLVWESGKTWSVKGSVKEQAGRAKPGIKKSLDEIQHLKPQGEVNKGHS